jgi:tripartite-type tricarboxylate transporter receptor subunit TctC
MDASVPGLGTGDQQQLKRESWMMRVLSSFLCLCFLVLSGVSARAEDYPVRPVKIIVPFGAGGPADLYARIVAQHLSDALKGSFVVDDRPGAGAVIGTSEVAKSAPDGYTLLMMSNTHTVNETILPNKPYKLMRDLIPVAPVNYSDLVMVVHPSVEAKNVAEFIALAKAKPGASTMPPPAPERRTTWPANCSKRSVARTSCTFPIAVAAKRAMP